MQGITSAYLPGLKLQVDMGRTFAFEQLTAALWQHCCAVPEMYLVHLETRALQRRHLRNFPWLDAIPRCSGYYAVRLWLVVVEVVAAVAIVVITLFFVEVLMVLAWGAGATAGAAMTRLVVVLLVVVVVLLLVAAAAVVAGAVVAVTLYDVDVTCCFVFVSW